jgi:hypothetical protein
LTVAKGKVLPEWVKTGKAPEKKPEPEEKPQEEVEITPPPVQG